MTTEQYNMDFLFTRDHSEESLFWRSLLFGGYLPMRAGILMNSFNAKLNWYTIQKSQNQTAFLFRCS